MDESIRHFGPAMRYSSVHFDDLRCMVTMDYVDDKITLMQPYNLGGRVVCEMDEYQEFEGNIKDFVRHKQAEFKKMVAPILVEYNRQFPDKDFAYYPNDINYLRCQLDRTGLTDEQVLNGWTASVTDDGVVHYIRRNISADSLICEGVNIAGVLNGFCGHTEGWIYRVVKNQMDEDWFNGPVETMQEAIEAMEEYETTD